MGAVERNAAEVILDHLVSEGVRYIFVGPATNHQLAFLDALYDRQDEITPILVRHEAMASLMAEGWFRATHQPGVFHVGAGPSMANTVIGVQAAYACGSGIVGISGQVSTEYGGRNAMQEIQGKTYGEGYRILEPVLKRFWQVTNPNKLPEVLDQAFSAAITPREGPVLIDVPLDVFDMPCTSGTADPLKHRPGGRPAGDPDAVLRAFEILSAAERPVMLCGGGVIAAEASSEAIEFAERVALPVVTTYTGMGAIPGDHPLSAGTIGSMGTEDAMQCVREADVVLALGTRFTEHTTSSWEVGLPFSFPPSQLIQVDIQPEEIGRYYPVEVGIWGDVKQVLRQLLGHARERLPERDSRTVERIQVVAKRRQGQRARVSAYASLESTPIRPERLLVELRRVLPRDGILLPGVGNHGNFFNNLWEAYLPQTYIVDRGTAAMGYESAAALGVKLARPSQPVVVATGDGCMTQVNWVLATAAEYDIQVKFIVLNNYALGGLVSVQEKVLGGRVLCSRFENHRTGEPLRQDFAQLAASYQVKSARVERPADIEQALRDMLAHPGPYLLEVPIDPSAAPQGAGRMTMSAKAP